MNDLELTFNPNMFLDGIKKINDGLVSLNQKFQSSADKMNTASTKASKVNKTNMADTGKGVKLFSEGMNSSLNGLLAKVGAIGAAYLGFKSILSRMPEIGQTFSIAGEILMKNLLWPLRQELMPYLQKVLDWVRENRFRFLQWGTVLVNIFRAIIQVGKAVIDALKPIFDAFSNVTKKMFGNSVKTISDLLNIVLFRLTVVALFMVEILKPVFRAIGKLIEVVYDLGKVFMDNALNFDTSFLGTWTEAFTSLSHAISELIDELTKSEVAGPILDVLRTVMAMLGKTINIMFVAPLKFAILVLRDFIKLITFLISGNVSKAPAWLKTFHSFLTGLSNAFNDIGNKISNFFSNLGNTITGFFSNMIDGVLNKLRALKDYLKDSILGLVQKIQDKINELTGKVKEVFGAGGTTAEKIKQQVQAAKDLQSPSRINTNNIQNKQSNNNVKIDIGEIKLTANNPDDARTAADEFTKRLKQNMDFKGLLMGGLNENALGRG
jgi:phage-related protein